MGTYLRRFWQPDGSGMNRTERMGGSYMPYIPDKLADRDITLSSTCASAVANAQSALVRLDSSSVLTDTEPLARMLLRAEAVSSSRIEGLEMPAGRLLEYEELDRMGVDHRLDGAEAQVIGNIHALSDGLSHMEMGKRIEVDTLRELNRALLRGTRLEEIGGTIRREQNWIGGNRVNPVGAAYVPPPPEEVPGLLEDLVVFMAESQLPAVAVAALAHAQFETIHPFADGNGRVGRALIHLVLKSRGFARTTVPPVSLVLATDRERYVANLAAYRADGGDDVRTAEAIDNWIEYFAHALTDACSRAEAFEKRLEDIRQDWLSRIHFRAGSAGRHLIDILTGTPAISIKTGQQLTGKSYPAVRNAVNALVDVGILRQRAKNRKSGIYIADDVVEAFNSYERSLATASGDTAGEKPRRPVPQRRA